MTLLYKYYSNENKYALENLKNSNISFSPLESLNDPFEGLGHSYLQLSNININTQQKYTNADNGIVSFPYYSEDVKDALNFKNRVFCASKEYDNSLLWAYYANSHRGFCVGYNKEDILKVSEKILDIKYSDKPCEIKNLDTENVDELLTTKDINWKKENECRALYEIKYNDVTSLKKEAYFTETEGNNDKIFILCSSNQTKDLKTLVSDKFIIKPCKASVIYLGLKMDKEYKMAVIEIAQKLGIKVYQMMPQVNSFNVIPEELSYNYL